VLFNARSQAIARALNIPEAHKDSLCLKCHAVEEMQSGHAISEGVGCGACHGPAEKWLPEHTLAGWKSRSNTEKEELGFLPLSNLVTRSLTCAGCHVGNADREVNHDLIAAGHPRLAFEYTSYHFRPDYRQHWMERTPQPDFEVRAWVCGQAATLRAATELLQQRAERAVANHPRAVWPEFSGYSCFSCHQKIGAENLQQGTSPAKRQAGVPGWELWSSTAAKVAAELSDLAYPGVHKPDLHELDILQKLMGKPIPNPKAIAAQAKRAVAELDIWLAELHAADECKREYRLPADAPRQFVRELSRNAFSKDRQKLADLDWDAWNVNFLGCAAMYHAAGGYRAFPEWSAPLTDLRVTLKFPLGFNSPGGFGTTERERVRKQFEELHMLTKRPGETP
jgi:uncharacterized CHY-type Zn-finger protein